VIGSLVPADSRKAPRYYVLEIVRAAANAFGDPEPEMWVVVSPPFQHFGLAWRAASDMRERHPGRVYIAGELCLQLTSR
jgi:hypothetical protein